MNYLLVLEKNNQLPNNWTSFKFDKYLSIEYGKGLTKKNRKKEGKIPVYGSAGIDGYHTESLVKNPCLIIGRKGNVGEVHYVDKPCWAIDTTYFLNEYSMYDLKFLHYLLTHMRLGQLDTSTTVPSLRRDDVYAIQMILPPLNEQKIITAKIEELFSEIDSSIESFEFVKKRLDQYTYSLLTWIFFGDFKKTFFQDSEWKQVKVGELFNIVGGGTPSTKNLKYWNGEIPWITSADIHGIKDIRSRRNVSKNRN